MATGLPCAPPKHLFAAVQLHRGQEVSIRQVWQAVSRAADADELLGFVVVRRELLIADRPVVAEPVVRCGFEIEIRESVRHPAPVKRFTADDSCPHPEERLARLGGVWVFGVFDVELAAELAGGRLHPLVLVFPTRSAEAAIHRFVRPAMRAEIAFGIHGRAGFEDEHFHAALGEFLRGHAAGSSRADDDCVVDLLLRHRPSAPERLSLGRAEAITAFRGESRSSPVLTCHTLGLSV